MSEKVEQFSEVIKKLIPISDLSPSAQNDVIGFATLLQLKKKKFLFKEGDRDNYSYYILAGELELIANKQVQSTIIFGSDNARYAISQLQPRQFSAKAKTPVTILRLDRDMLDRLMVHEGNQGVDATGADIKIGVSEIEEEDSGDWMTKILQSGLFSQLPMANIQQMFICLNAIEFNAGDTVIKQGEPGDHYYIVGEGSCKVTRVPREGEKPVKLGELSAGDAFGEEALLTGSTRNSTVTMLSSGVLMQLSKDLFMNLIKKPLSSPISFNKAQKLIDEGGKWVDVRFPKEYAVSNIENSINIPLNILRPQLDKFNKDTYYVVCCDTGSRSSAAAFILMQEGFSVSYLGGGFVSNHKISLKKDPSTDTAPPEKREKTPEKTPRKTPRKTPGKTPEKTPGKTLGETLGKIPEKIIEELDQTIDRVADPVVKVSILEAELAKNKIDIEKSNKKQQQESEELNKKQREAIAAERKKLEQEKIEIEEQKKLADKEAKEKLKEEEERIKRFEQEAKAKIQKEKKNLEELYVRNTEKMKKLQEEKAREEAKTKKAQEQQDNTQEAKIEIEAAAEKRRIKQSELEKKAEAKVKQLLEEEKSKLAGRLVQINKELEQAKRDRMISGAARNAAKEEAAKIIDEYKVHSTQGEEGVETSLKSESVELEKEAQQVKDRLDNTHRNKETVEAGKALEDVQHEEKIAKIAEEENMESILGQTAKEEVKFNEQMAAELDNWKKQENKKQEQFLAKESQLERIRRITERAEAAKKKQEETVENLFAEISAQISDDSHRKLIDSD